MKIYLISWDALEFEANSKSPDVTKAELSMELEDFLTALNEEELNPDDYYFCTGKETDPYAQPLGAST